jgi:dCTP deaminase
MSVLGRGAILSAIQEGHITITPFRPDLVGPASVDLTLANTFRVFRKVHQVITVLMTPITAPTPTKSTWRMASTS